MKKLHSAGDIAMCGNKDCPSYQKCGRSFHCREVHEHMQTVGFFEFDEKTGKCEHFYAAEKNLKKTRNKDFFS